MKNKQSEAFIFGLCIGLIVMSCVMGYVINKIDESYIKQIHDLKHELPQRKV